jgi:hypothetical protein
MWLNCNRDQGLNNVYWFTNMQKRINVFQVVLGGISDLFAITYKNTVFWDMTPCDSCNDQRFTRTYRLHHQDEKTQRVRNNSACFSY